MDNFLLGLAVGALGLALLAWFNTRRWARHAAADPDLPPAADLSRRASLDAASHAGASGPHLHEVSDGDPRLGRPRRFRDPAAKGWQRRS